MCKSLLYAVNSVDQPVIATGTTISFGTVVRKFENAIDLLGGNAILKDAGYYDVDTNLTFTADGTGTAVIQLYKDGQPVTGATASVGTLATIAYPISIPAVVKNFCCKDSALTVVVSGVAGTVNNASIVVEKL